MLDLLTVSYFGIVQLSEDHVDISKSPVGLCMSALKI